MVDVEFLGNVQKAVPTQWPGEVNLSFWEGFSHHRAGQNNSLRNTFRLQNLGRSKSFNNGGNSSSDSGSSSDDEDTNLSEADRRAQLLKTTQLVYDEEGGRVIPRLKAPRQLYGFTGNDLGPQQLTFWPAEVQVAAERIVHLPVVPPQREPLYVPTGREKTPLACSHEGHGRVVFSYEPADQGFFVRSRVGGARIGCVQSAVGLQSSQDNTLIFESRFESGNLAKAVQISEYEYELWLRTDLYTNRHTQWYYFAMSNTRANVTYRFNIVNFMKPDSLYNNGMKPLMYSERRAAHLGAGWTRLGSDIKYYRNNVKYTIGKTERWCYSLTWTFSLPHDNDTVYFAYSYPYTYSDLRDYLNDAANDPAKASFCKRRLLCRSLAGNAIYLLTITAPMHNTEQYKKRKGVVITARVHPGETNASWMMKGFLDFLLGPSSEAQLLRNSFVFKIVPMLNPDGVIIGNYRCSLTGRDLNRNYNTVLKNVFPPIYHTRNMIKSLMEEREIVLYCDLHGHSRKDDVFIYGCENRGVPEKRLRERIFPMMLSKNAPDLFSYKGCKFKVQKHKEGTGRVVMWRMGILNSYTMEATFCSSSSGKLKGFHYTTEDFEAMGYHFCDTLLDFCDPDPSKYNAILTELEEKMRAEILQILKQKEGYQCERALSDIDLDEEYLSEVESSDGGSNSSASDGPPLQLQLQLTRRGAFEDRKKVKKTRKERDRLKSAQDISEANKKAKEITISNIVEKPSSKTKPPVKVVPPTIMKRPRSQTLPNSISENNNNSSGPGATVSKGGQHYLENLTSIYMRSQTADPVVKPKERSLPVAQSAVQPAHAPMNYALPLGLLCPRHEHVLVSELLARHMQHLKFPDDIQDVIKAREQQQLAERRVSTVQTVDTERQRQKLLASASRRRQDDNQRIFEEKTVQSDETPRKMEMENFRAREVDANSGSLIKQHPPPFDERLERERSGDWVKAVDPTHDLSELPPPITTEPLQPTCINLLLPAPFPMPKPSNSTALESFIKPRSDQSPRPFNSTFLSVRGDAIMGDDSQPATLYPVSTHPVADNVAASSSVLPDSFKETVPSSSAVALVMPIVSGGSISPLPVRATQRVFRKANNDYKQRYNQSISQTTTQIERPFSTEPIVKNDAVRKTSLSRRHTSAKLTASPENDIQSTFRAIKEIKDDLLDPVKRGSLSPTTGNFVEHIVHKTDAKVNAIREQLEKHLERKDLKTSADSENDVNNSRKILNPREMRLPLVEEEIYVSGSGTSGSQRTDLADSAAKLSGNETVTEIAYSSQLITRDRMVERDKQPKRMTSPTKISLIMSKGHPDSQSSAPASQGGVTNNSQLPAGGTGGQFHAYPLMVPGKSVRAPPLMRVIPHRR